MTALSALAALALGCTEQGPVTMTDTWMNPPFATMATTPTTAVEATTTGGPADSEPTTTTTATTGPEPGATDTSTTATEPTGTGEPAPCVAADCPVGQFCSDAGACEPGCDDDADCANPTKCDLAENACKGCLIDGDCPLGTVCDAGTCVAGCDDMQPCQDGLKCCAEACVDPLSDLAHCGDCGVPCAPPANAEPVCAAGLCGLGPCADGFSDCDKDPGNGCEVDGACLCEPGDQQACYGGPDGTEGVGVCAAGLRTCNPQGTGWGPCAGQVTPGRADLCDNGLDDDCDGEVDEDPDEDKDGYSVCGGDCCDAIGPDCLNPELVNPGAFEVMGNDVDDDCDAIKDNPLAACDAGLASDSNVATDYAKAIDLCKTTTENAQGAAKRWGVISATFSRASGAGAPDAAARSIRPGFGTNVAPQQNQRLAVLSTGNAADFNDASPAYADFQAGKDNGANSAAPADWLAANGDKFPNAPGCPAAASKQANNSVMLKLRVRVPTNAKSFNVQMFFYSAEWPEWTCTAYNDMFVALLTSQAAGNPADKNIAIYTTPQNQKFPVGVNLVKAASGLFTQCKNGEYGCSGSDEGTYNGCTGQTLLAGTGFHIAEGGCGANNTTGGGTGWLKMAGNVKGGETMEIRFVIWDTADGFYDSLVLLDDWVWSVQASKPGVSPN